MKQYECDLCGYVYDEAAGDPDNGIAPGTKWHQIREGAIRPFSAGTLGRTRSSREPRMKQAAASPIPTVRELKANAGQKAAPSWVENQAISAPTSTILQITGGRGASAL